MPKYPGDIDQSQCAIIAPILESSCKTTSTRTLDLYDVFCGKLYILKSRCQQSMMPKGYLNWNTCYYRFRCWSKRKVNNTKSIFADVLKKLVQEVRFQIVEKKKPLL